MRSLAPRRPGLLAQWAVAAIAVAMAVTSGHVHAHDHDSTGAPAVAPHHLADDAHPHDADPHDHDCRGDVVARPAPEVLRTSAQHVDGEHDEQAVRRLAPTTGAVAAPTFVAGADRGGATAVASAPSSTVRGPPTTPVSERTVLQA